MTADWHLPDPDLQPEFYADTATKRLLAWIIDTVIVAVFCILVLPFTAFTGLFFFPFLFAFVGFCYRIVTIARSSATWGMRLLAIEFRNSDGSLFDLSKSIIHTTGTALSFSIPILQLGSIILMLTSARGQGLTDHAIGSVVLNRRARA